MTLTRPELTPPEPTTRSPHVTVIADRCAGCQECVIRCPTGALSMNARLWIAEAKDSICVGCRQCVRTCPFSAITVDGPVLVGPRADLEAVLPEVVTADRSEVRRGLPGWTAALAEAARCLACPDPTCVRGCPAHNDIPGFIAAITRRDLTGAHRIISATSVLPDICSRVCDQSAQCEGACTWSLAGDVPVAIGVLERFVADQAEVPPLAPQSEQGVDMHVAVVGSGPAGIGAAWELRLAGARVTVYEKDDAPGGLLRWGIPEFTLPAAIAERPWRQLTDAGVELCCGSEIDPGDLDELLDTHDAVIFCHGAGAPLRLPVPGADLAGVEDATAFLTRARAALASGAELADLEHRPGHPPATVLVLGAGNTAMDVARTVLRLGARPICVDWMDPRFAPVRPDELAEARAEGVEVRFCTTLERLEPVGEQVGVAYLARTRQDRADRLPKVLARTSAPETVDLVVMAMGYRSDRVFADALPGTPVRRQAGGVPDRTWQASGVLSMSSPGLGARRPVGTLALGREVGLKASSMGFGGRIWAAGDALVGPSTVVEAMAQGRRAARAALAAQPRRPGRTVAAALVSGAADQPAPVQPDNAPG